MYNETWIKPGPLEREILDFIWEKGDTTVRDVYRHLSKQREIAYTTILTTVTRMAVKGYLEQNRKKGLAYVYRPLVTKEDLIVQAVQQVFENFDIDALQRQRVIQALR